MLHRHLPASIFSVQAVITKSWGRSLLDGLLFAAGREESGVSGGPGRSDWVPSERFHHPSLWKMCTRAPDPPLRRPSSLNKHHLKIWSLSHVFLVFYFLSIFMPCTKNSWIPKCARIWHWHPEIPALVWSRSLVDAFLQINKYPSLTKDSNVCPILWKQPRGTGDSWGDG